MELAMADRKSTRQVKATQYYHDPNHDYFSSHFEELVNNHGGKWIILAKGHLIAICEGGGLNRGLDEAEKRYPESVPFATPIPRAEDIEGIL
jgi:hypothetical protein